MHCTLTNSISVPHVDCAVLTWFLSLHRALGTRVQMLSHNRIYTILQENRLVNLRKKAAAGTEEDGTTPATLNPKEAKAVVKAWLDNLFKLNIAKNLVIDRFTLTEKDFIKWAEEVVACFPGEVVGTWYSPKPTPSPSPTSAGFSKVRKSHDFLMLKHDLALLVLLPPPFCEMLSFPFVNAIHLLVYLLLPSIHTPVPSLHPVSDL